MPAIAGVSPWIPFESERGHITIPITYNGEPATAMLDTGLTGTDMWTLQRREKGLVATAP